jgi:hypothetical protein
MHVIQALTFESHFFEKDVNQALDARQDPKNGL